MTGTPPDLVCPVCGTSNPSSRLFCRKCAADLHAPVPTPGAYTTPVAAAVPVKPIVVGGGIALAIVALLIGLLVVLGGSPAASPSPTPGASPTAAPPTAPPEPAPSPSAAPSEIPSEAAPIDTPEPTPVPPPTIKSFKGPESVDCATDPQFAGTIHLTWRVTNAESTTLSIDGTGIYERYPGVQGQADAPFSCSGAPHTYTLTTVGGVGPAATATLTIGPS